MKESFMQTAWEWALLLVYTIILFWRSSSLIKALMFKKAKSPHLSLLDLDSGLIRRFYFVGLGWVLLITYLVHHEQQIQSLILGAVDRL
jgi:hypothetical protein